MRTPDDIRRLLDDRQAMIATLRGEAIGESLDGQLAVACAIRNRVTTDLGNDGKPDWWGETYRGVALAPAQFSCWWEIDLRTHQFVPNTVRTYTFAESLIDGAITDPATAAIVKRLGWIVDGVISGAAPDLSNGANHYLTTALLATAPPKWAIGRKPCAIVDHHTFFKL